MKSTGETLVVVVSALVEDYARDILNNVWEAAAG
jgi:hypothetical protein